MRLLKYIKETTDSELIQKFLDSPSKELYKELKKRKLHKHRSIQKLVKVPLLKKRFSLI